MKGISRIRGMKLRGFDVAIKFEDEDFRLTTCCEVLNSVLYSGVEVQRCVS